MLLKLKSFENWFRGNVLEIECDREQISKNDMVKRRKRTHKLSEAHQNSSEKKPSRYYGILRKADRRKEVAAGNKTIGWDIIKIT